MSNKFDKILDEYREADFTFAIGDARYLKLSADNDPITGTLTLTPSSATIALEANQAIVLKSGKKMVYDG